MEIITVYAVVNGSDIITTTENEEHAQEQCEILNKVNKTDSYIVVACNGFGMGSWEDLKKHLTYCAGSITDEIELRMEHEKFNADFRKVLHDPSNKHTDWFNSLPIQKKGFVVKSCMRGVDIEEIKKRCEMF